MITAIALAQIPSLVSGMEFKWRALIEDIDDFSPELRNFQRDGTVIEADYDGSNGWAMTQQAFLWWLADLIKQEVRDDQSWNQWLEAQEFGPLLTKAEKERFNEAAKTVNRTVGRGAATLIEAFLKGVGGGLVKSVIG